MRISRPVRLRWSKYWYKNLQPAPGCNLDTKNKNFRIFVTRITSTAQTALTRCMKRIHAEQNVNLSHFYSKSAFFKPKSIENHVKFRFRPVHLSCYSQLTTHKLFVRSYLQQIDTIFRPAELRKHQNCLFFYGHCIQNRLFRIGIGKKSIFPEQNRAQARPPRGALGAPLFHACLLVTYKVYYS